MPNRLTEGVKHDSGKARWSLMCWDVLREVAEVVTYGAAKYDDDNWLKVDRARYEDALERHLTAWRLGEHSDPETGFSHLSHALCNVMFIAAKEMRKEGTKNA